MSAKEIQAQIEKTLITNMVIVLESKDGLTAQNLFDYCRACAANLAQIMSEHIHEAGRK